MSGRGARTADDPFCSIQFAIDSASNNSTVRVYPGNYREAILIDVNGLTLEAVKNRAVVDTPYELGTALTITADNVTVEGLLLKSHADVVVLPCGAKTKNVTLRGNKLATLAPFIDSPRGIFACDSTDPVFVDNEIQDTTGAGIVLGVCPSNQTDVNGGIVAGNRMVDSASSGIVIAGGSKNSVLDNVIRSAEEHGIVLECDADDNTVTGNQISRSAGDGILVVEEANNNEVAYNKSRGNKGWDINDEGDGNTWGENICKTAGGSAGPCVSNLK